MTYLISSILERRRRARPTGSVRWPLEQPQERDLRLSAGGLRRGVNSLRLYRNFAPPALPWATHPRRPSCPAQDAAWRGITMPLRELAWRGPAGRPGRGWSINRHMPGHRSRAQSCPARAATLRCIMMQSLGAAAQASHFGLSFGQPPLALCCQFSLGR